MAHGITNKGIKVNSTYIDWTACGRMNWEFHFSPFEQFQIDFWLIIPKLMTGKHILFYYSMKVSGLRVGSAN